MVRDELHFQFGKREVERLSHPNEGVRVCGLGAGSPTPNHLGNVLQGKTHLVVYLVVEGGCPGDPRFSGEFRG